MLTPTLPYYPDRAWRLSFWLAFSLTAGISVAGIAWLARSPDWMFLGALVLSVIALPGFAQPRLLSLPYRIWNRMAREYSGAARLVLMGICFYTMFVAVGWAGSVLQLERLSRGSSNWMPRGTLPSTAYGSLDGSPVERSNGWLRALLSWMARSGHLSLAGLIPYLLLLHAFEPGKEGRAISSDDDEPTGIYSLY